tara:strand:+ start:743 stop:1201 length:459 start_codon:yes stop_codon:yes gene_type:complete
MKTTNVKQFDIVGIRTRTINDGSAAKDIPALWNRFMSENILENIPNRTNNAIYCLYTEYEGDHTQPYDVVLGCKVNNTNDIPDGFTHLHVPASSNAQFLAKGVIEHGQAVVETWMQIWQSDLDRAYSIDYEVYDERAENLQNAEVDIFIALK